MSPSRKRKSNAMETPGSAASSSAGTPAKRGGKKQKVINLDVDDPFNFEAKGDTHPEPLKNISMELSSFGGMKFTRSPNGGSERYAGIEKIAERRSGLSSLNTSSSSSKRPPSLSALSASFNHEMRNSTPKSAKAKKSVNLSSSTVNNGSSQMDYNDDEEEEDEEKPVAKGSAKKKATPKTAGATPSSEKREPRTPSATPTASSKASAQDENYIVPVLSAEEQVEVDLHVPEGQLLSPGARVMALWGQEYYAAHVCGREGLGRYYIHFAEDNLNRVLPPTGVIPLAALTNGQDISFIFQLESEESGKAAKIENAPSNGDADEWTRGIFELKTDDSEEIQQVSWDKIYLTKEQGSKISIKKAKTVLVDTENIVNESRSSRRSRASRASMATAVNASANSSLSTSLLAKTPGEANEDDQEKPPANKSNRRSRASRASNANTTANASLATLKAEESKGEEALKSTNRSSHQSRASRASNKADTSLTTPTTGSEEKEEPKSVNRSSRQSRASRASTTKADASIQDVSAADESLTGEEQNGATNGEEDQKEKIQGSSANGSMPIATPSKEKVPEEKLVVSLVDYDDEDEEEEENGEANEEKVEEPIEEVKQNGKEESGDQAEPVEEAKEDEGEEMEEESGPGIFAHMKVVLTSASRSKKSSDFNKREYRTMIEERGGDIIDDFSDLQENDKAFLVADTHYRTHKYLTALSLSVPCVKHNWILECVNQNKLIDHVPFMLPAGESTLDSNKICEWKQLKGFLLQGKRVWVYSTVDTTGNENVIGFVQIWSPLVKNLGGILVEAPAASLIEKLEFCRQNPVDILLADASCEKEVAEAVEAEGGIAISSEWVIQAIVTGELPDVETNERFHYDSVAGPS